MIHSICRFMFRLLLLGGALVLFADHAAFACSVPVFRYSLDNWRPDLYTIAVEMPETPDEAARQAIAYLEDHGIENDPPANYTLQPGAPDGPGAIRVFLPGTLRARGPVYEGPLTEETARRIVDSPIRQTLAEQLLAGQTTVFLFLESGDKGKDEPALATLEKELKRMEEQLTLPEQQEGEFMDNLFPMASRDLALRLDFSILRVRREDPQEAFLVENLLRIESDLLELGLEPMAFPVFGQGRGLYALVGAGINADTVRDACSFLIGPCSCQVKDLNPGVDLLMAADWSRGLNSPEPNAGWVMPLTGIGAAVDSLTTPPVVITESDASVGPSPSPSRADGFVPEGGGGAASNLPRNLLIVGGLFMAIILLTSFMVTRFQGGSDS